MSQQFKNTTLTRVKVRNNILKVWEQTTEEDRFDWYQGAHDFACKLASISIRETHDYNKDVARACGVIAALSPMVSWDRNKTLAIQLYNRPEAWNILGCLKASAKKAYNIIQSDGSDQAILEILKGKKTSAFFLNILYPDQAISLTIDRHALSIAVGQKLSDDKLQITAGQYEFFQECYRWTAAQLGINPLILQSATWVVWRRK